MDVNIEQKLIDWFNNKIDHFEHHDDEYHRQLFRSNTFQHKCEKIWNQLNKLRTIVDDTLKVQNNKHPLSSSSLLEWIKIVLIPNYRSLWLKILFKSFLHYHGHYDYHHDDTDNNNNNGGENLIQKISIIFDDNRQRCSNLITMIYWLDHARLELTEMIIHPCLFRQWPQSSEKILEQFARITLYPEQWQRLKFRLKQLDFKLVHYEQQFHHLDFHIKQLSIDLANGVRLARIVQLLFPERFSITLLSQMKPGKDVANVRLLFKQCQPIFNHYDKKFEWNAENAVAIAGNYRQQTLETLQSLMRIEFNLLIEQRYCYHLKKIVFIQRYIRGRNETRKLRDEFLSLRQAAIVVQRRYRAKIAARKQRSNYIRIREATITIQRWFRCRRNIMICRNYINRFLSRRQQAAQNIQRFWRGYRCRKQIYDEYPLLGIISINLSNFNLKTLMTIGTKTEKILKRMEKLAKNSLITNHQGIVKMISDQLIGDLIELCHYTDWSLEIRNSLLQRWQNIIQWWIDLLIRMNRSEQHKMSAIYIVSILLNLQKTSSSLTYIKSSDQLMSALIHIMYNHFNHPSLLADCLHLINGLMDYSHDLVKKLSTDPKWKRLTQRIESRYLQPLKMNNILGQQQTTTMMDMEQCDQCRTIQAIIKTIMGRLL